MAPAGDLLLLLQDGPHRLLPDGGPGRHRSLPYPEGGKLPPLPGLPLAGDEKPPRQEEFCLAERGGTLGRFNCLTPLYAAFHEDDKTFSLLWTAYDDEFPAFQAAYLQDKARHGSHHGILGKAGETPPPNAYTVSCLPWVSFRHFAVHSYEKQPYLLPSVESGRLRREGERLLLPFSLTVHHAAADGWQVHQFLTALQKDMDRFQDFL